MLCRWYTEEHLKSFSKYLFEWFLWVETFQLWRWDTDLCFVFSTTSVTTLFELIHDKSFCVIVRRLSSTLSTKKNNMLSDLRWACTEWDAATVSEQCVKKKTSFIILQDWYSLYKMSMSNNSYEITKETQIFDDLRFNNRYSSLLSICSVLGELTISRTQDWWSIICQLTRAQRVMKKSTMCSNLMILMIASWWFWWDEMREVRVKKKSVSRIPLLCAHANNLDSSFRRIVTRMTRFLLQNTSNFHRRYSTLFLQKKLHI
jgi:hypothetical protein